MIRSTRGGPRARSAPDGRRGTVHLLRGPRTCLAGVVAAVLETIAVLALLVLVGVVVMMTLPRSGAASNGAVDRSPAAAVSDRHRHRWTRWEILDERRIHLYGEVDEGRELPDRIDVVMRRECARCGYPQTQTVRGLDPDRRA